MRLAARMVEKPWGRRTLWPGFAPPEASSAPIGEIWFEDPRPGRADPELLVKYLFTAEKLSIQVHPDDAMAREMGLQRGKDEAWVVLGADPHATIGIGLREVLTRDELRAAALDGSIEHRLDWRVVAPGDVFYSPAGTIHAIGAGITLVEIQQNCGTTFRFHDYGSARALHLDQAIAAADPVPYLPPHVSRELGRGRTLLAEGPAFVLERWTGEHDVSLAAGTFWLVPLAGAGAIGDERLEAGGVWFVERGGRMIMGEASDMIIAYPGAEIISPAPANPVRM